MNLYGAGKNGTRVEINGDFSILIPYGCIYTTETEEDSQIVFKLSKPKELPASYREGVFALGDEGEKQNWVLELKRIETDEIGLFFVTCKPCRYSIPFIFPSRDSSLYSL